MGVNHYDVLGVPATADVATIRRAFHRLARQTHPDLGGDAAEFAAVALAWSVLCDPTARAAHDAELAGGDGDLSDGFGWGEEVGLDDPVPAAPRPAAPPPAPDVREPAAPDDDAPDGERAAAKEADDPAAGRREEPAPRQPVDPFTSPPRTLPQPDTSGILRRYPRPIGGWALYGFGAAVLLSLVLAIAFPDRLAISPGALVGLLAYACFVAAALVLRSLSRGLVASVVTATLLLGVVGVFVLGASDWAARQGLAGDARVTRVVVVAVGTLVPLAVAAVVEVRRTLSRRVLRELRRIEDASAAARRWNVLLHALATTPGARVRSRKVRLPGGRGPEPGWAVVDPQRAVRAAATEADRDAWCTALRAAGIDVATNARPAATRASRAR